MCSNESKCSCNVAYHALDANEAQLAEANEAQLAEANEAQLAEANEKARLQVALDRIEAAGYDADIRRNGNGCLVELYVPDEWDAIESFYGATRADAAEAAAAWAESQKEGKA